MEPSYTRGYAMLASLTLLGPLFPIFAYLAGGDWRWLLGGAVLVMNWPYTLLAIMPTNNRLMAIPPDAAGAEARRLIEQWGSLHAICSALGAGATMIFLWALN